MVETAVSTNQKPAMYRNLYENTGPDYDIYDDFKLKKYNFCLYCFRDIVWILHQLSHIVTRPIVYIVALHLICVECTELALLIDSDVIR